MWVPLPRVTYTWKLVGQWALGWDFSPMLHFLLEYLWVWKLLTLFFVLTLTAFIFTVVPASVTFTNNWIKCLFSFSKIRKWLTRTIWRAWPAGPIVSLRPRSWLQCRRMARIGRYVSYFPLGFVSNMSNCATSMYSRP
jgi:hypothetical protein